MEPPLEPPDELVPVPIQDLEARQLPAIARSPDRRGLNRARALEPGAAHLRHGLGAVVAKGIGKAPYRAIEHPFDRRFAALDFGALDLDRVGREQRMRDGV